MEPKDREATLSRFGPILKVKNQASFCPYAPREVSVLTELAFGHLRYLLADVPPQPNSPPDPCLGSRGHTAYKPCFFLKSESSRNQKIGSFTVAGEPPSPFNPISKATMGVVVFH